MQTTDRAMDCALAFEKLAADAAREIRSHGARTLDLCRLVTRLEHAIDKSKISPADMGWIEIARQMVYAVEELPEPYVGTTVVPASNVISIPITRPGGGR